MAPGKGSKGTGDGSQTSLMPEAGKATAPVPAAASAAPLATVQNNVPAYLKKGDAKGMERVTAEDLVLPRIKILQALSPEVNEKQIAKAGEMVLSLDANINFGTELEFVPVLYFKSRIRWTPRNPDKEDEADGLDEGAVKGIECISPDGVKAREPRGRTKENQPTDKCAGCVLQDFRDSGKAPRCSLYMNFAVLVQGKILILSFEKTKIPAAKNLLTFASMLGNGGLDLYAGKYRLVTQKKQNDKGVFYVPEVQQAGYASEEENTRAAAEYERLKDMVVVVDDLEKPEGVETGSGGGDGGAPPF